MNTPLTIAMILLAGWMGQAWAGKDDIRHGRYLIQTSGCNDCHTAGYMQKDGHVPKPTG